MVIDRCTVLKVKGEGDMSCVLPVHLTLCQWKSPGDTVTLDIFGKPIYLYCLNDLNWNGYFNFSVI